MARAFRESSSSGPFDKAHILIKWKSFGQHCIESMVAKITQDHRREFSRVSQPFIAIEVAASVLIFISMLTQRALKTAIYGKSTRQFDIFEITQYCWFSWKKTRVNSWGKQWTDRNKVKFTQFVSVFLFVGRPSWSEQQEFTSLKVCHQQRKQKRNCCVIFEKRAQVKIELFLQQTRFCRFPQGEGCCVVSKIILERQSF